MIKSNVSNSNHNNNITRNLEVECHYLSQALRKLKRRSPEWTYLHHRLEAAEEELEAVQTDLRETEIMETVQLQYPPPPSRGHDQQDDTNVANNHVRDMGATNADTGIRPLHEDNDDDSSRQPFVLCKSTDETTTTTIQGKNCVYLRLGLKLSMLIAGILLIACNLERHPEFSATSDFDEDINLTAPPVPSEQWGPSFSSFDSNFQPRDGPCAPFSIHLVLDQFGNETSWELISTTDDNNRKIDTLNEEIYLRKRVPRAVSSPPPQATVVLSGGPYHYQDFDSDVAFENHNRAIIAKTCLQVGSYKFVLHDAQRDGICCDYGRGEYGLNLSMSRVVRPLSSGTFLAEKEVTSFQVTEDDIDILPDNESVEESSTSSTPTFLTNVSLCFSFHLIHPWVSLHHLLFSFLVHV
jgi:hypothetical protein